MRLEALELVGPEDLHLVKPRLQIDKWLSGSCKKKWLYQTIKARMIGAPIRKIVNQGPYQVVPSQVKFTCALYGKLKRVKSAKTLQKIKELTKANQIAEKRWFLIFRVPLPRKKQIKKIKLTVTKNKKKRR